MFVFTVHAFFSLKTKIKLCPSIVIRGCGKGRIFGMLNISLGKIIKCQFTIVIIYQHFRIIIQQYSVGYNNLVRRMERMSVCEREWERERERKRDASERDLNIKRWIE